MEAASGAPILDPRLPRELERTIFEVAARSRRRLIPQLMRVAWRVKEWVEPLLYEIVLIRNDILVDGHPVCSPQTLATKTLAFLQNSVRHLFFDNTDTECDASDLDWVLTNCGGITNILTDSEAVLGEHLPTLCALSSLRRLTTSVDDIFVRYSLNTDMPLFRHITHLEFLDPVNEVLGRVTHLALMPALTHVAFNVNPTLVFEAALLPNARLRCIVFICTSANLPNGSVIAQDPRFVSMRQNRDYQVDWVRGADTGNDYWTVVEAFIHARRTGKVDRSRFHIEDTDESWF
ncbi:hypothetical protein C8R46DRAFT_1137480 [Mycena filopes]|nr:hypothetical protein C8R46DRAFT_1137480 [Mycena filopes]